MMVATASFEMAKQQEALTEFLAKPGDTVALMPSRMKDLNLIVAKDEENEMLTMIYLTDNEVSRLRQMLEEALSFKSPLSISNRLN